MKSTYNNSFHWGTSISSKTTGFWDSSSTNKWTSLLIIMILGIISIGNVEGAACSAGVVEDCYVDVDVTFPPSTYYVNDSDCDGGIRINASNLILDCNNSVIYGNFVNSTCTYGFYSINRNNVTIKNCNIFNYSNGIKLFTTNATIINNNISSTYYGIELTRSTTNITNNTINNTDVGTGYHAIKVYTYSNNSIIEGNTIHNYGQYGIVTESSNNTKIYYNVITTPSTYTCGNSTTKYGMLITSIYSDIKYNTISKGARGIELDTGSSYATIKYNNISDVALRLIHLGASNNSIIDSNNIYRSCWNALYMENSWNATISNNLIQDYNHTGIDEHTEGTVGAVGGYSNIFNNKIINTGYYGTVAVDSIYLEYGINNNIFNNTITNSSYRAIYLEGGLNSSDNNISNNLFTNIGWCAIYDDGANNTYINNTLTNITTLDVWATARGQEPNATNYARFINNNNTLRREVYYVGLTNRPYVNITIQNLGEFNVSNSATNSTINIINQLSQYPFNDVKNVSTNTILSSNVDNYSITLSPNQQIEVGDFRYTGQCINSAVNLTIPYYNQTPICINATGNISINFTGFSSAYPLNDLREVQTETVVRSDFNNLVYLLTSGLTVRTGNYPTVLTNPPSDDVAIRKCVDLRDSSTGALTSLTEWMIILVILVAVMALLGYLAFKELGWEFSFNSGVSLKTFIPVVMIILITGLIIIIGIIVLSRMC